jgi:hypothetical protein
MEYLNYTNKRVRQILSAPFVWAMIVPLVFLDITLYIYQQVVFYLYDLDYIKRSKYIKIDRHKLEYLDAREKLNCAFCGYGNGIIAYAAAILAQTELYWCGIKHDKSSEFIAPKHHSKFVEYNDKKGFIEKYRK